MIKEQIIPEAKLIKIIEPVEEEFDEQEIEEITHINSEVTYE